MRDALGTITGKAVRQGVRLKRSGGQALPGLVVEKLFPQYMASMLAKLPEGVIIITGTNGKTTTTKIVTELLRASGKKVLTNSTGSNLTRGIVSSLAQHANPNGRLNYDMAVLEVDEATARRLVAQIKPRWVLGLNVSRDQLDRFGEVDMIAKYVGTAMQAATEGIVVNARDPHLYKIATEIARQKNIGVVTFGAAQKLAHFFPSDYELAAVAAKKTAGVADSNIDVVLSDFSETKADYVFGSKKFSADMKLSGQHNYLNGAAALALCLQLLPKADPQHLIDKLSKVSLAFGRGEKYQFKNGVAVELVLVKNPASFTQAISSYGGKNANLMIAINDNIADGRDVSWLWDVDFSALTGRRIFVTSGKRAADMALRLSYDDVKVSNIEPSLLEALRKLSDSQGPKVILATYTAMLRLYKILSKQGKKIE
jgi:lipid II isoglutaminyl synthase (glutamine-hydrolysing)